MSKEQRKREEGNEGRERKEEKREVTKKQNSPRSDTPRARGPANLVYIWFV